MKNRHGLWPLVRTSAAACLLSTFALSAHAFTPPSILGSYSGINNGTDSGCTIPADNGTYSDPATIAITSQSGTSFSGNYTDAYGGDPITGTIINVNGDFSFTYPNGSGSGTYSSGTVSVSYSGTDPADGCTSTGTFTGTGGNPVVSPTTAPSTSVTTQQTLTTNITTFTTAVVQRLTTVRTKNNTKGATKVGNGFMLQDGAGMSSGDAMDGTLGIWGSINYSDSENDFSTTSFDSKRSTLMVGVDMSPVDNLVLGLAVGYENSDTDTKFNGGEVNSNGLTFIGYGTYAIDETFSVDLVGGVSQINVSQFRLDPDTAAKISSSTDSDRLFFSGNLNASREYDNWFVTARAGMLWATEGQTGFTESNGSVIANSEFGLGQLRVGGEAAYLMASDWEPYGSLTLEYDYRITDVDYAPGVVAPSVDRTGAVMGLGVRYFGKDGITGNFEYSTVLGRDNYSEDSINMTLRAEF